VEAKLHEMKSSEVIGKLAKELQGAGSFTGLESLNQQILRLLQNHNIYYRVHKSPPPVHILSHLILSTHSQPISPNVAVVWLTFLVRTREVPGSNLGPETGYLD
jgi:hypothetical protein